MTKNTKNREGWYSYSLFFLRSGIANKKYHVTSFRQALSLHGSNISTVLVILLYVGISTIADRMPN